MREADEVSSLLHEQGMQTIEGSWGHALYKQQGALDGQHSPEEPGRIIRAQHTSRHLLQAVSNSLCSVGTLVHDGGKSHHPRHNSPLASAVHSNTSRLHSTRLTRRAHSARDSLAHCMTTKVVINPSRVVARHKGMSWVC